ncbi:MAG: Gfo/Idh/MocA family oxidoreductase [Sphingobacteriales bacterium]|nr:MAG: Gfo/Idh/MocA family oxidoreductase [Sphingobacteriales bacterium]
MKKYKVGIIGYGGFGKFLHHWWAQLDQVEIVAIADSKLERSEVSGIKVFRHWEELVASDLDIVSVVTPPSVHAEIAAAAMQAGKHVLLEKPVAISNAQIAALTKVMNETGKVILVNHMLRYNPIVMALSELSHSGQLGPLRHAEVSNYAQDSTLPKEHWFWNRDFSGGIMVEHAVHFIDIVNSLTTQQVESVQGTSSHRNEVQEDQVAAMIKYSGGLIANHYHGFSGPGFFEETTIRLVFDLARIEIKGWIPMNGTVKVLANTAISNALESLPGWEVTHSIPIESATDVSRPEGWGEQEGQRSIVNFGGADYQVDNMLEGTFGIPKTKGDVYGQCVQDILKDMITLIENPAHKTRVNFGDAVKSVEIALRASGR